MSSDDLSERPRPIALPRSDRSARPGSVDELAQVLREATAGDRLVGIRGGGSKATWGALGADPDVVVDTTGLDRVVEHSDGDLVATVEAGARLADVQDAFAPAAQWLPLDPPEVDATIGGVVATAAAGPRRYRFGTPRDRLIGITVVLADGTVARSGGKVVKNVAGYDLGKLFTGSFGTLGVIASCTFRLQPRAMACRVVSIEADDPAPVGAALTATSVTPSAVEWDGTHVHVVVESSPAAADAQVAALTRLLGGTVTDALPAGFGRRPWRSGDVALKLTHRLSATGPVVAAARRELAGASLAAHVGSGVVWAGWQATPADARAAVRTLRAVIASYDGSVVVVDAPNEVKQGLDVWGPVAGLEVMHRIKERFDPDGRMNPGRFVGGI